MAAYSFAQLEDLWIKAGGNKQYAPIAASVAMAESSGNPQSTNHNTNGSWDMGLWQINMGSRDTSWFDPVKNAREAIRQSHNGKDWRPWCTAYTDGACGTKGGSYTLGSGSPAGKILSQNHGVIPANAGSTLNDATGGGGGLPDFLNPEHWVSAAFIAIVAPIANLVITGLELFAGAALMVGGVFFIIMSNPTVRGAVQQAGQMAAMAAV